MNVFPLVSSLPLRSIRSAAGAATHRRGIRRCSMGILLFLLAAAAPTRAAAQAGTPSSCGISDWQSGEPNTFAYLAGGQTWGEATLQDYINGYKDFTVTFRIAHDDSKTWTICVESPSASAAIPGNGGWAKPRSDIWWRYENGPWYSIPNQNTRYRVAQRSGSSFTFNMTFRMLLAWHLDRPTTTFPSYRLGINVIAGRPD
jgi:hypothetical protein